MTRTSTTTIAVAADYADAMMTARKAKNVLFLLLLLILLAQLTLFLLVRFNVLRLDDRVGAVRERTSASASAVVTSAGAQDDPAPDDPAAPETPPPADTAPESTPPADAAPETPGTSTPTTPTPTPTPIPAPAPDVTAQETPTSDLSLPSSATPPADPPSGTPPAPSLETESTASTSRVSEILRYVIPVTNFLGMTLSIVLAVVLLLIVTIMLVGRLIGVSHVTSAFIWCVLLTVLLFPWQSLLIGSTRAPDSSPSAQAADPEQYPDFKIPGVLYTWPELKRDWNIPPVFNMETFLKWARFVGMPVVALIVLLMTQAKSSRGLRFALGESDVQVEVNTTAT